MSAEPPPPPQVSPDGKFYWDGERWVPMQGQAPSQPPPMAQQPRQLPPGYEIRKKGHFWRNGLIGSGGIIALIIFIPFCAGLAGHSTSSSSPATNSPAASIAGASSAPPSSKSQFTTFGSGTKVVGIDIQPGTYRTRHDRQGCYLARLKGFSGSLDDTIANAITNGPVVVTIGPTDKGFQSSRCDTWTSDLSPITTSTTSFGEGDFIVGTDMVPGIYRNTGATSCYWARLSGFGHTPGEIIANGIGDAQAVVTIAPTDKGFESSRCGTWTKIS